MKYQKKQRDRFGSRPWSLASKVNRVVALDGVWHTDREIAKKLKLSLAQVQRRLSVGTRKGIYERERVVRYRIKESK